MNESEKNISSTESPPSSRVERSSNDQSSACLSGNGVPMPDWASKVSDQMDDRIRANNLEDPTPNTLQKD
jgi:hypothetical protein